MKRRSGEELEEEGQDQEALPIAIEDSIDLHGFQPRDIPDVVLDYLEEALDRGFTEVRLIHGRGIGVQRARIQQILTGHPSVLRFQDAPPARGGWGATVVWLKPRDAPIK